MLSLDQIIKVNNPNDDELIKEYKDGATLNLTTLKPVPFKQGYCVAITDTKTNFITQTIENYRHFKQYIKQDLYLGIWQDQEDKRYCLDLTIILTDKNQAIETAKSFNQKAIFDLNTMETINI